MEKNIVIVEFIKYQVTNFITNVDEEVWRRMHNLQERQEVVSDYLSKLKSESTQASDFE